MQTFIIVAALMAAIAAAVVAVPLLRAPRSRIVGVIAAALVSGAAAGLYQLWSNWDWRAADNESSEAQLPQAARDPAVLAMVAKLAQHLNEQPNDEKGWLLMGRSDIALERADAAVVDFKHAYALDKSVEAALGLGEALSMRSGGEITQQASNLFEEALTLAPDDPKALFYGGFAAAVRGDTNLARQRWRALKDQHPPPQIEQMLDARLAELDPGLGTNSSPGGTNASTPASQGTEVNVNISVAPALKARVTSGAPLFVFAREPGGAGPPLAAKRLTTDAIGTQVSLSAADSMIPGRVLVSGQKVSITARVSFSGQPTPAAGDLYGEAAYEVGSGNALDLVIDRVAQ